MDKKQYTYTPQGGVCSSQVIIDTDGETVGNIQIIGGCHGNLQGISSLLRGMEIKEVIPRLEGIKCGRKDTSCPDQIAKALKDISAQIHK